jgi:hypothetical protein
VIWVLATDYDSRPSLTDFLYQRVRHGRSVAWHVHS